jgi:hypothetical protein
MHGVLAQEQAGDEEPTQYEEDVDPEDPAGIAPETEMDPEHHEDGDRTNPIERRYVGQAHPRQATRPSPGFAPPLVQGSSGLARS